MLIPRLRMGARAVLSAFIVSGAALSCHGDGARSGADGGGGASDAGAADGGISGSGGGDGADSGGPFPAFAPDLPTVGPAGVAALASPQAIPIFFSNDDPTRATAVADFFSKLSGSAYWTATTAEYGVGAIHAAPVITLTDPAPTTTDSATISSWLQTTIQAGGALPAPSPGAIYVIYYPVTTTIASGAQQSCVNFGGYHDQVTASGQSVVFAVIAGCHSYGARLAPGESIGDLDFTTGLTTHELVEATTDPLIETNAQYAAVDGAHHAWALYLNGAELADTCEVQPGAFFREPTLGYVVQRTWSNAAAAAGHDPCQPSRGPVFFNASPRLPPVAALGMTTEAIGIPAGGTATIEVDLASDGPTSGPWSVTAIDYAAEHGGGAPALSLSLDRTTGKNGDKLALTITVLTPDPSGYEGFILESSLNGQRIRNAGLVFQP